MKKLEKMYDKFYDLRDKEEDEEAEKYYKNILLKHYGTNAKCPHCYNYLLKSDLREYTYLCILCDENFYKGEER